MPTEGNPVLRAAPGDRLVVQAHHQGESERDGEILKVHGEDGAPPYLVRWEDGTTTMLLSELGCLGSALPAERVLK